MKHFNYNNRFFHADLFVNDNCIMDNEISNDISDGWDYTKGKPILVGFLHRDKMDIFLAENDDDQDFAKAVQDHVKEVLTETEIYSFNKKMELGNFSGAWGFDMELKEIKPFKAKKYTKDRFYNELIARQVIPDCKIADVFCGDASQCIHNWKKYQDTGKIEYAMDIVKHNMNCLLKESVIQKNKPYFLNNFNIDKKGWLVQ